jgi:hypothetical protein
MPATDSIPTSRHPMDATPDEFSNAVDEIAALVLRESLSKRSDLSEDLVEWLVRVCSSEAEVDSLLSKVHTLREAMTVIWNACVDLDDRLDLEGAGEVVSQIIRLEQAQGTTPIVTANDIAAVLLRHNLHLEDITGLILDACEEASDD